MLLSSLFYREGNQSIERLGTLLKSIQLVRFGIRIQTRRTRGLEPSSNEASPPRGASGLAWITVGGGAFSLALYVSLSPGA